MEALQAAVKAELGEDGLSTCRGAEVPAAEHGHGWSVSVVNKAEVKSEVSVDLYRETLVNVEIKSETSPAEPRPHGRRVAPGHGGARSRGGDDRRGRRAAGAAKAWRETAHGVIHVC